jgi:hypothetical protein
VMVMVVMGSGVAAALERRGVCNACISHTTHTEIYTMNNVLDPAAVLAIRLIRTVMFTDHICIQTQGITASVRTCSEYENRAAGPCFMHFSYTK